MVSFFKTVSPFSPRRKVPGTSGRSSSPSNAVRAKSSRSRTLNAFLVLAAVVSVHICANEAAGSAGLAATARRSDGGKTVIEVRMPPGVYLQGPTFAVRVESLKPIGPRIPGFIRETIQETLLKNDPRLKLSPADPDTLITCTITDLGLSSGVEKRTRSEYQKIGETTYQDPTTGVYSTQDQYGYVDVPFQALVVEGHMNVECEVKDVKTGIVLYSDKFHPIYNQAVAEVVGGSSSPSVDSLNSIHLKLADNVVGLILAQLSPRVQPEIVPLASGKYRDASKLLQAGQWNEALDLLDAMRPFKDPKYDAYRFYSLGVAHEALAHEALAPAETKRQLEQAVGDYRRATQLKPSERIFWGPKNRAELSLWQVSGVVAQMAAFEEAKKTGSLSAAVAPGQPGAQKRDLFHQLQGKMQRAPGAITNDTVVQWVRSGMPRDYIVASIRHTPSPQFNLSEAEVLKLRRSGVSDRIIRAMHESQGHRYGIPSWTKAIVYAVAYLWWLPLAVAR